MSSGLKKAFMLVLATTAVACFGGTKPAATDPHASHAQALASGENAAADEADDDASEGESHAAADESAPTAGPCPPDMVLVADRVCIDKYEASLVETIDGVEKPYPSNQPVDGHVVRAVS